MSISGLGQWISGNYSGVSKSVPRNAEDEFVKLHQRLTSEVAAAMAPWRKIAIPMLIGLLVSSGLLIYGAVKTLALSEIGRQIFLVLLWFLIPFDVARSVINTIIGHSMADIMTRHFIRFADTGRPQGAPDLKFWITGASQVGLYASLVFGVVWCAAKVTYYILALKYLRRADIVRLFSRQKIVPVVLRCLPLINTGINSHLCPVRVF
jgi:hypothetical protein